MRVAIMQPTYLPWMGYFGLMDAVDVFVLLDSVQFARRSWQQRNRIKTPSGAVWLTVPVKKEGPREQLIIRDVRIQQDSKGFPKDHVRAVELNYRRAPYFGQYFPGFASIIEGNREHLALLNISLIERFRNALGITTPLKLSSEMEARGKKAELLACLCDELGATEYVSPPGSHGYLDASDSFEKRGVPVSYFEFRHPEHRQLHGGFVPYMSAIDLLLNVGPDSLSVIRSGCTAKVEPGS